MQFDESACRDPDKFPVITEVLTLSAKATSEQSTCHAMQVHDELSVDAQGAKSLVVGAAVGCTVGVVDTSDMAVGCGVGNGDGESEAVVGDASDGLQPMS